MEVLEPLLFTIGEEEKAFKDQRVWKIPSSIDIANAASPALSLGVRVTNRSVVFPNTETHPDVTGTLTMSVRLFDSANTEIGSELSSSGITISTPFSYTSEIELVEFNLSSSTSVSSFIITKAAITNLRFWVGNSGSTEATANSATHYHAVEVNVESILLNLDDTVDILEVADRDVIEVSGGGGGSLTPAQTASLGRIPTVPNSSDTNKVWKTDGSATPGWRDDAMGSGGANDATARAAAAAAQATADAALPLAGGTMTGKITLDGAPTANRHAATKLYVDEMMGGTNTSGGGPLRYASVSYSGDTSDTGTFGVVPDWTSEDADSGDWFSSSAADRFTVPAGVGRVRLHASVRGNSLSATLTAYIRHISSGTTTTVAISQGAVNGTSAIFTMSTPVIDVDEGDYFQLWTFSSDSAFTLPSTMNFTIWEESGSGSNVPDKPDTPSKDTEYNLKIETDGTATWEEDTGGGSFTSLSDTPSAYTGEGGKFLAVNSGASAVEFVDAPSGGTGGTDTTARAAAAAAQATANAAAVILSGTRLPMSNEGSDGDWWIYGGENGTLLSILENVQGTWVELSRADYSRIEIDDLRHLTRDLHTPAPSTTWIDALDSDGDMYQALSSSTTPLTDANFNNAGASLEIATNASTQAYVRLPIGVDHTDYRIVFSDGFARSREGNLWTVPSYPAAASTTYQYWRADGFTNYGGGDVKLQKRQSTLDSTFFDGRLDGKALEPIDALQHLTRDIHVGTTTTTWSNVSDSDADLFWTVPVAGEITLTDANFNNQGASITIPASNTPRTTYVFVRLPAATNHVPLRLMQGSHTQLANTWGLAADEGVTIPSGDTYQYWLAEINLNETAALTIQLQIREDVAHTRYDGTLGGEATDQINDLMEPLQHLTRDLHVNHQNPNWENATDDLIDLYGVRTSSEDTALTDANFGNNGAVILIASDAATTVFARLPVAANYLRYRVIFPNGLTLTGNSWTTVTGPDETTYQYWRVGSVDSPGNSIVKAQFHEVVLEDTTYTGSGSIPTGGTTGQALVKSSGDSYDVEWGNVAAGDGGSSGGTTSPTVLYEDASAHTYDHDGFREITLSRAPAAGTVLQFTLTSAPNSLMSNTIYMPSDAFLALEVPNSSATGYNAGWPSPGNKAWLGVAPAAVDTAARITYSVGGNEWSHLTFLFVRRQSNTLMDVLYTFDGIDRSSILKIEELPNGAASGEGGGDGGSSTFTGLTDTPSAFTSQGGKVVAVNSAADALEFVDAPSGTDATARAAAAAAELDAAAAQATADAALSRSGGTMTGKITLDGAPTVDLHAATKKYVDDNIGSGGSGGGTITTLFADTTDTTTAADTWRTVEISSTPGETDLLTVNLGSEGGVHANSSVTFPAKLWLDLPAIDSPTTSISTQTVLGFAINQIGDSSLTTSSEGSMFIARVSNTEIAIFTETHAFSRVTILSLSGGGGGGSSGGDSSGGTGTGRPTVTKVSTDTTLSANTFVEVPIGPWPNDDDFLIMGVDGSTIRYKPLVRWGDIPVSDGTGTNFQTDPAAQIPAYASDTLASFDLYSLRIRRRTNGTHLGVAFNFNEPSGRFTVQRIDYPSGGGSSSGGSGGSGVVQIGTTQTLSTMTGRIEDTGIEIPSTGEDELWYVVVENAINVNPQSAVVIPFKASTLINATGKRDTATGDADDIADHPIVHDSAGSSRAIALDKIDSNGNLAIIMERGNNNVKVSLWRIAGGGGSSSSGGGGGFSLEEIGTSNTAIALDADTVADTGIDMPAEIGDKEIWVLQVGNERYDDLSFFFAQDIVTGNGAEIGDTLDPNTNAGDNAGATIRAKRGNSTQSDTLLLAKDSNDNIVISSSHSNLDPIVTLYKIASGGSSSGGGSQLKDLEALPDVASYEAGDLIAVEENWYKLGVTDETTANLFSGEVGRDVFNNTAGERWRGISSSQSPNGFSTDGEFTANPDNTLTLLLASSARHIRVAMKRSVYEAAKGSTFSPSDHIAIRVTMADGSTTDEAVLAYYNSYERATNYIIWQHRHASDNYNLYSEAAGNEVTIEFFTTSGSTPAATTTPLFTHTAALKHWLLWPGGEDPTEDGRTALNLAQANAARLDALDMHVDGVVEPLHSLTYNENTALLAPLAGSAGNFAVSQAFNNILTDDLLVIDWRRCDHLNHHDEYVVPGSDTTAGRMYLHPRNFDNTEWNGEFVYALDRAIQDNGSADPLNSWIVGSILYSGSTLTFGLHLQQGGTRANRNLMPQAGFSLTLRIYRNSARSVPTSAPFKGIELGRLVGHDSNHLGEQPWTSLATGVTTSDGPDSGYSHWLSIPMHNYLTLPTGLGIILEMSRTGVTGQFSQIFIPWHAVGNWDGRGTSYPLFGGSWKSSGTSNNDRIEVRGRVNAGRLEIQAACGGADDEGTLHAYIAT